MSVNHNVAKQQNTICSQEGVDLYDIKKTLEKYSDLKNPDMTSTTERQIREEIREIEDNETRKMIEDYNNGITHTKDSISRKDFQKKYLKKIYRIVHRSKLY